MPNECKPRSTSVVLSPGKRPATRSGSSTPTNDHRRTCSHSPAHQRASVNSKSRGSPPAYKVRGGQTVVRQQSISVRAPHKSSYAAQCSAVAPLKVFPKTKSAQCVSGGSTTPKRPLVLRVSTSSPVPNVPTHATPTFGSSKLAFGQIVRLDLSKTDDTQSGGSLSAECAHDCCVGNQSGQESSNTSARFEIVAVENPSKGAFLGDTNSTCSGSSTPRIDTNRSPTDEIAAAIAAARFAASRGSMDHASIANGSGKRVRESELYVDCARLRWRLWDQEATREEGQEHVAEEVLAPPVASFAAHLLWEHDRAVLEGERCNVASREARLQTERAEEALSRAEHESVSMDALRKKYQEATEELECAVAGKWNMESSSALSRCEHLQNALQESECGRDRAHASLAETVENLQRSKEAYATLAGRMEHLEEQMLAESEVGRELRHELSEHESAPHIDAKVEDKTPELAQELQRMIGLYEKQEGEMQEMLLRSEIHSAYVVEHTSTQHSSKPSRPQATKQVSSQTEPDLVNDSHATNLEEEAASLQELVQHLAEELGRTHNFLAEVTHERDALKRDRVALRTELEEAVVCNATLEEEALRLRSPRDQESVMRACDVLPPYPVRPRSGRTTVPQASTRNRSQLLAEALARENRRLRNNTRAVGQSTVCKSP